MDDIGTDHNPYIDASPITGRKFTRDGILSAAEGFANHERYLSLAQQTPASDRQVHKRRADILWAMIQLVKET